MKFQIVDAFTDKIFGGNPAGIVILPKYESFLMKRWEKRRQNSVILRRHS